MAYKNLVQCVLLKLSHPTNHLKPKPYHKHRPLIDLFIKRFILPHERGVLLNDISSNCFLRITVSTLESARVGAALISPHRNQQRGQMKTTCFPASAFQVTPS